MIYFLDFDRTLFDTDSYNASLPDEPGCAPFRDELIEVLKVPRTDTLEPAPAREEVWEKVAAAIRSGALSFPPGALSRFLYPDVPELLRSLGNEAIIMTYGDLGRQRLKIDSGLSDTVRLTVLYTLHESKAEFLSHWPGYYGQEAIFVDDRTPELEALSAAYPKLKLFQMKRDGKEGDGRWPVIRSLAELP